MEQSIFQVQIMLKGRRGSGKSGKVGRGDEINGGKI